MNPIEKQVNVRLYAKMCGKLSACQFAVIKMQTTSAHLFQIPKGSSIYLQFSGHNVESPPEVPFAHREESCTEMLTVRNLRQKPAPQLDKRIVWIAGILVFALFLWTLNREYQNYQNAEKQKPTPVKPAAK
jgi:hypothetical protein